ncbi:MAG: glycosyltransferase [Scytonema sp. RU_4_4]|nr:glycosyltransferase [Scytonema sp. RU_4_4]
MPYSIIEIEVTQPLPTLSLSESDTGIALILRRKDQPIGFLMQALPAKSVLSPEDLAQLITKEVGTKLLQESIREELIAKADFKPLPSVTVAICTKDRPDDLARCLNHLLALKSADNVFEVLVVDNASSDERTHQVCSALPGVRYVREMKAGLGFARNRALQEATGEMITFIDDDVVVDRNWWRGLTAAIAENPDAAGFTGLVLPYELVTQAQILFEQRGGFRRGFETIHYGQILPGNNLYPCGSGIFGAGCNMTFRRDVLLKLGGFDEALAAPRPGGDDLDIFYRIIREGYSLVYEPRYMVFHRHRREYEKLRHQYWTWGLGFMAFIVKSYTSDPAKRSVLSKTILWWFKYELRQIKQCLTNQHPLPVEMILAELWGGVVGILGEYPRSLRRAEKIRRQFS